MNNVSLSRILTGLGIISIGVLAALGTFDVIDFANIASNWWPVVLIGLGIIMLIERNVVWGLIVAGLGGAFLLRSLDYTNFNVFELFWPAAIILVGVSILFNRTGANILKTNKSHDDVTAILGGVGVNNTSDNYTGGKATAIMGGVTIDLRKATIKKEATLQVMSFWGGIEVKVPEDWVVKNRTNAIIGGVDVKTPVATKKDAPVLHIVGDVIMAGVDVKN